MPYLREPYNSKYCKAVKCQHRIGNKCTLEECARHGHEKLASHFATTGKLAEGDEPDA